MCVCVLVCCCCLCCCLWLLMHLACVARARITCILCRSCRNALQDLATSHSLSLSLPLSLSLFCSLCVFFTGHAPDGSLMTERMTRVHSTSTSPSVRPELLPLPACGKVLLPCCLLFFYFVATLSLGINC